MSVLLVTGSAGLVGSEISTYFHALGWEVHGLDSFQRAAFFGPQSDTRWNQDRLKRTLKGFRSHEIDVRDRDRIMALMAEVKPEAVVHTASQPSHDKAAEIPFIDFSEKVLGLNH